MPEHHVFGWYVHPFKWPPIFHGLDANIRLGVIDDADETYVNGTLIGKSGVISGSSAWQQERHYLLPSANISPHSNLLACHVWSKWGMGGILGKPILTASLMKNGQSWKRHILAAPPHLEANGLASPQPRWTVPPSSSSWHPVPPDQSMPDWSGPSHYAIYRTSFSLADLQPFRTHVILELGSVLDVAAVYLNHRLIGQVGRFPTATTPAFIESGCRIRIPVPQDCLLFTQDNDLQLLVYRENGMGGISGRPGLMLADTPPPSPLETAERLIQGLQTQRAIEVLDRMTPADQEQASLRLSCLAYAQFLLWQDGHRQDAQPFHAMLTALATHFRDFPQRSPSQSAMQALCRVLQLSENHQPLAAAIRRHFPQALTGCRLLPDDRSTQGDWIFHYGTSGYVLAAMGQLLDWCGGNLTHKDYRLSLPSGRKPRLWLPQNGRNITDRSALLMPRQAYAALNDKATSAPPLPFRLRDALSGKPLRRAAWWDDQGELTAFNDDGPNLDILLNVNLKNTVCSLYLCDVDWRRTWHPRQQSVILFNAQKQFIHAAWAGKLDDGIYLRFLLPNTDRLTLRVNKHRGACTAVSGLFLDTAPTAFFSQNAQNHASSLPGVLDQESADWLKRLTTAQGEQQFELAQQLDRFQSRLLTPQAGPQGLLAFVLAAEWAAQTREKCQQLRTSQRWQNLTLEEATMVLEALLEMRHIHIAWNFLFFEKLFETTAKNHVSLNQLENLAMTSQRLGLKSILLWCGHYLRSFFPPDSLKDCQFLDDLQRYQSQKSIRHSIPLKFTPPTDMSNVP